MNKIFATVLTVATLASTGAFADSLTVGSATRAPVFANQSGNTTVVETIGSATRAPIYALNPGKSSLVVDLGSASRAPTFAALNDQAASIALAE